MTSRGDGVPRWVAVHATATGAAHRRQGRPCEDAAGAWRAGPWVAIAVADGHGGRRYPRAARGAALAVGAITTALVALPHGDRDTVHAALVGLPRRLHAAWRAAVLDDVRATPLTAHELRVVGGSGDDGALTAHGTTVIGAAASRRWLVLAQVGDGDALVAAGADVERPVGRQEDDPRVTDSLCQPDAPRRTRVGVVDLAACPAAVVLVATDGFGSAFERQDWHGETARHLVAAACDLGDDALAGAVGGWCEAPARVGGDDVALALLVARPDHEHSLDDREDTT
jgi:hypothetical protein